jgi:hypothetical protein
LANGITSYQGYNYGGEDQPGGMVAWTTGPKMPAYPLPSPDEQGRMWYYGSGAARSVLRQVRIGRIRRRRDVFNASTEILRPKFGRIEIGVAGNEIAHEVWT